MRLLSIFILAFVLFGCGSTSSINPSYANNDYSLVLFPQIEGDTANYVHKRFSAHFADKQNVSLISYDEIDSSMKTLGFTTEQYKLTIAQLQSIAELHGAQGILFGKVKSGARSITSSIDIDSSIELALVDVQSGVKVVGEAVEETMSLRERRSVLRSVSDEIISRYDKIFDKINR